MERPEILRIVVASPGDVQPERDILSEVVDELNQHVARAYGTRLDLYRWETDTHPGFHPEGPQGLVDDGLAIADCDLFICVFWKRFGTPTADSASGTEHEFRLAYDSWKQRGRPQIMIYFKQASYTLHSKEEIEQLGRVVEFRDSLPAESFWWTYEEADEFGRLARNHLTQFLRRREQAPRAAADEQGPGRALEELLQSYRNYFLQQVSTVRLFEGTKSHPLEKVFVDLTITEEYERPLIHTAWLSLADAELRRRREVLPDEDESAGSESEEKVVKVKRTVKPDELLHGRTHAVITGAPGCGKTTLIRYLAMRTLAENNRFPVLLELKTVTEQSFLQVKEDFVELLFEKTLAKPLQLDGEAERGLFRKFFTDRLRKGEVAVFIDGLDEVRGEKFFPVLCKSVNTFLRSAYRSNDVVITTRPYALETRFEGLQEMEIAPLNPGQVQAFLDHYYADCPEVRQLTRHLRRHRELSGLARVPFLLGVIAELYRHQGQLFGARLELYRQIVKRLVVRLDKEKSVVRFLVADDGGLLKRELLKRLAFERLFLDPADKDIERLVFTDDDILEKAQRLCRPEVNPNNLVSDAIATPLLREVGAHTYAFAHLTIQEYLAAEALSERDDFERIFCQKVFNSTIVSMEVLPMLLGLIRDPNPIYTALEELPESLTLTALRLRARGLAYAQKVAREHLSALFVRLLDLLSSHDAIEVACRDGIFRSLAAGNDEILESLIDCIKPFVSEDTSHDLRMKAIHVLGELGDARAAGFLMQLARADASFDIRQAAQNALRKISGGRLDTQPVVTYARGQSDGPFNTSIKPPKRVTDWPALSPKDKYRYRLRPLRGRAYPASMHLVSELLKTVLGDDPRARRDAAQRLLRLRSDMAVRALGDALKDPRADVRLVAAVALGRIRHEEAEVYLLAHRSDSHPRVRQAVEEALTKIRPGEAPPEVKSPGGGTAHNAEGPGAGEFGTALIDTGTTAAALTSELRKRVGERQQMDDARRKVRDLSDEVELRGLLTGNDPYARRAAAEVLIRLGSNSALDVLAEALADPRADVRLVAAVALGRTGRASAIGSLLGALRDESAVVRRAAAEALGKIGDPQAVDGLLDALSSPSGKIRRAAAVALGKIGDPRAVRGLLATLKQDEAVTRRLSAEALGKIGDPAAVSDLSNTLLDKNLYVRWAAAEALKNIGTDAAIDGLLSVLSQPAANAQVAAATVLGELGDRRATKGLILVLRGDDTYARKVAAEALGRIGDPRAMDALLYALKDISPMTRRAAAEALGRIGDSRAADALLDALDSREHFIVGAAAEALGKVGGSRAVGNLLSVLRHEDSSVRNAAATALLRIQGEDAIVGLLEALKGNIEVAKLSARTLARHSDAVLARGLERALSHPDEGVRRRAVQCVGYYSNDPHVPERLSDIARNDQNQLVKEAAREALVKYERKQSFFRGSAIK